MKKNKQKYKIGDNVVWLDYSECMEYYEYASIEEMRRSIVYEGKIYEIRIIKSVDEERREYMMNSSALWKREEDLYTSIAEIEKIFKEKLKSKLNSLPIQKKLLTRNLKILENK